MTETELRPQAPLGIDVDLSVHLTDPFWSRDGTLYLPLCGDVARLFAHANRLQTYQPAGFVPEANPKREARLYCRAADFESLQQAGHEFTLPGESAMCLRLVIQSFVNQIRDERHKRAESLRPPPPTPFDRLQHLRENFPSLSVEARAEIQLEIIAAGWFKMGEDLQRRILEIAGAYR